MSYKGSNFQEDNALSNAEIKSILLNIYDRLTKPSTKEVGYELFLKLILKNLYSSSSMSFILSQLSEFIPPLPPKEKEPCLKLLSLVFFDPLQSTSSQNTQNSKKKTIYYQYLSSVLSIIQSITKDSNNSIFTSIANTYAEIVQNLMPTDISYASEELNMEEKRAYEMLQGFCIYNMKQEEKANRIIGSLCLTKLVENCPIVLQEHYMKFIWDNIINFIETKNYTAKYELLNCLISLILGAEGLFSQYANATLYKVLDFLTEDDWNKRKLALNVIYTLIFYCKDEIMPLKEHIINFLRVLKTDKIKEVREVCLLILQRFNENEPIKKKNEKEKSIGSIINNKNKINKNTFNVGKKENNNMSQNIKNKSRPKTGIKRKKNNKFFENNNNFNNNPFKDNSYQENNDNKRTNNNSNNIININNEDFNNNNIKKSKASSQTKESKETNINSNTIGTSHISSNNKNKTRKSNNFVNEKMVIKPDPNKSIFKAIPNPAFFGQGNKNNNDIVVLAKGKPIKTNQNNNNKININNNYNLNAKDTPNNNNNNVNIINKDKDIDNNNRPSIENNNNINFIQEKNNNNKLNNNINNNNNNKRNIIIEKKEEREELRYKNMFINDKENENEYEEENISINNIKDEFNENEGQKYNRNTNNENMIEGVDQKIIQKLLTQMDFLTKGHSSLVSMFDNIQLDTREQIEYLNKNYEKLESKTNILNNDLKDYYTNGY